MARFRRRGAAGLVSGKRGKQSNRRLPAIYTDPVLNLVREHYSDFGPTLAREKLLERHELLIGRETLRGLMRDAVASSAPQGGSAATSSAPVLW
jgi:hypothetical protein